MSLKSSIITRFSLVLLGVIIIAFVVVGKVVYIQIATGDKWKKFEQNRDKRKNTVTAERGNILSCDGRELACSVPAYNIHMDALAAGLTDAVFTKGIDSLSIGLSKIFRDKTPNQYKVYISKLRKKKKRYARIGNRRISYNELKVLKKLPIFRLGRNRGGFIVDQAEQRKLPFGSLAARTIGKLYGEKEKGGMIGLERAYNSELKGKQGINALIRISNKWVPDEFIPPIDGHDILTTIDVEIQDVAEKSLMRRLQKHEAHHGSAIVMEVATGEIKAIVNLYRLKNGSYTEDNFNYAIGEATEPGSTFKLASVIVALEDGVVDLNTPIDIGRGACRYYDRTMRDSHTYQTNQTITLRQAFEISSNVGISKIIWDNYKSDPHRFIDRLYNMGLNRKNGIEIKGEGQPMIKDPDNSSWSGVSLPWMSIGYELKITPMQMLTFYNAVANNGKMMKPLFVKAIYNHGEKIKEFSPEVLNPAICSSSTIDAVHELLLGVVERGTATNIKTNNYLIAGKTGTAQIAKGKSGYKGGGVDYQASFVGYFPANRPKYSCIVVINNPKNRNYSFYGNVVAGSVFRDVADRVFASDLDVLVESPEIPIVDGFMPYSKGGFKTDLTTIFEQLNIPYSNANIKSKWISTVAKEFRVDFKSKDLSTKVVPNVKGMGIKDAVVVLESLGLKVVVLGRGKVISQSINSGEKIKQGCTIKLILG